MAFPEILCTGARTQTVHRQTERQTDRNKLITITLPYCRVLNIYLHSLKKKLLNVNVFDFFCQCMFQSEEINVTTLKTNIFCLGVAKLRWGANMDHILPFPLCSRFSWIHHEIRTISSGEVWIANNSAVLKRLLSCFVFELALY